MIELDIHKALHGSQGEMQLDVTLHVEKGEFIALMGESGSGKTTLLRILAGLEVAEGSIVVDAVSWQGMPVQKREIGFVFQDYALFDNMTVEENLLFVNDDKALTKELLEMTELLALKNRNVTRLSGGQKQRVALCRAMMNKPKLLLMDEPLSALDTMMRTKLQNNIKELHLRFGTTTIMVSHDVPEVFALASRVLVLEQGKVLKDGSIEETLLRDNTSFKAEVLSMHKSMATVSLLGRLIEVEVSKDSKVGENINITLHGTKL
jgi:molybdate transport system ATP-binding protein